MAVAEPGAQLISAYQSSARHLQDVNALKTLPLEFLLAEIQKF
ncbi:hypothetical protein PN498_05950 [Oscillatoria sp. CS-180]|nr:hypothetical protein [Oscillatoria sp. CS-180]MDB9525523.1 hypothetical protein [Oscillatoria sp. CS-180]